MTITLPLPSPGTPVLPDWAGNLATLAEASLTEPKQFYVRVQQKAQPRWNFRNA